MKKIVITLFLLLTLGCSTHNKIEGIHKSDYAKPIKAVTLENFHKVDAKIYRSAQPGREEFKALFKYGIRYTLNLRQFHDDTDELKGIAIEEYHIPINTSKMSYNQLVEAVSYLVHRDKKTLVHCLHGSDRTGTVIAGYRIAVQGWSKEKAIDEFVNGGFGYHSFWFSNLPQLLNNIDIEKFKQDVYAK